MCKAEDSRQEQSGALTWSVREKLSRPAERRTTDLGIVTRAVATHRTMSVAEGGLLSCIGVPATRQQTISIPLHCLTGNMSPDGMQMLYFQQRLLLLLAI